MNKLRDNETARDYVIMAYKLQMTGDIDGAIEYYDKSLAIEETAECWTFLGWAYSHKEDYVTAIECCERAIILDPGFGNPKNDIGAYLITIGEYEAAIPYLEQAIEAERYATPWFPFYNLGKIYERLGDWFRALDMYKESLKLEPTYEPAHTSMVLLQASLN